MAERQNPGAFSNENLTSEAYCPQSFPPQANFYYQVTPTLPKMEKKCRRWSGSAEECGITADKTHCVCQSSLRLRRQKKNSRQTCGSKPQLLNGALTKFWASLVHHKQYQDDRVWKGALKHTEGLVVSNHNIYVTLYSIYLNLKKKNFLMVCEVLGICDEFHGFVSQMTKLKRFCNCSQLSVIWYMNDMFII